MYAIVAYFAMTAVFADASKAETCWILPHYYHYPGCFRRVSYQKNGPECTEISLAGYTTSVFEVEGSRRTEMPFVSTNHNNKVTDKVGENYTQTPSAVSTLSSDNHHVSIDRNTPEISVTALELPYSTPAKGDEKSTTEANSSPNVSHAFTLQSVFFSPSVTSPVHSSESILASQVTTSRQVSTLPGNVPSTTSEMTTAADCMSAIYKTEDEGVSQLFIERRGGIQSIQFQAKARTGIRVSLHVSLATQDFVEVKIGGDANDRSEIRSCSVGPCALKTEVNTLQYLTSEEFREFWVTYSPGESLIVGKDGEETPFMQWLNPPSLEFEYIAFSTDDFKSGVFRFCNLHGLGIAASPPCTSVSNQLNCTCEVSSSSPGAKVCHCLDKSTGMMCLWLPNDCDQLWQNGVVEDGIYTVYPAKTKLPFHVYCNMTEDAGWTMLQRRVDGEVDFNKNHGNYVKGFGNLGHEFWLGNEKIYQLTNQNSYTLRIDMVIEGQFPGYAEYDAFRINDGNDDYRLSSLGSFTGSVFDSMSLSFNMKFSAFDHDRDTHTGANCASASKGGWWYQGSSGWCYHANLNGLYGNEHVWPAIIWYKGTGTTFDYLLTYVDMKIRPNSGTFR